MPRIRALWIVTAIVSIICGLLWATGWIPDSTLVWLAAVPGNLFIISVVSSLRSGLWPWDSTTEGERR